MGLLDRLEQSIERLFEGTTSSIFRQKLQPVEIGKRLERAMLSQQQVSVNAKLVPNAYEVRLNPKDYARFAGFKDGLARQLESALAQTAARHHLTPLGRIHVTLTQDDSVSQRRPEIIAEMTDQAPRSAAPGHRHRAGYAAYAADETGVIDIPTRASSPSGGFQLLVESGSQAGRAFPVPDGASTIGRSSDNTIVLDEPDVSRRHARLERNGNYLRIQDMNSKNGTWINGEAVHLSDIQPGDRIRLGSQELRLDAAHAGDIERRRWR